MENNKVFEWGVFVNKNFRFLVLLAACLVLLMPLISTGQLLEKHVTVNNKDRLYLIYVPTVFMMLQSFILFCLCSME